MPWVSKQKYFIDPLQLNTVDQDNLALILHDWLRTVFQIEDPDPYLLTHGGQTRHARGPVQLPLP